MVPICRKAPPFRYDDTYKELKHGAVCFFNAKGQGYDDTYKELKQAAGIRAIKTVAQL